MEKLDDFKYFLQLHNKLPVTLLHLISEPVFQSINGLPADLQRTRHRRHQNRMEPTSAQRSGRAASRPQTLATLTEDTEAALLGTWETGALAVSSFPDGPLYPSRLPTTSPFRLPSEGTSSPAASSEVPLWRRDLPY